MASSMVVSSPSAFEVLSKRYSNAYKVAKGIITYGGITKGITLVLGIGILLIGAFLAVNGGFTLGPGLLLAVMGIGLVIGGYIAGVLIQASGQLMLTTVDTAVNTSTLISVDEKGRIIGS